MDNTKLAQIIAKENAVIESLKSKGLLPKEKKPNRLKSFNKIECSDGSYIQSPIKEVLNILVDKINEQETRIEKLELLIKNIIK